MEPVIRTKSGYMPALGCINLIAEISGVDRAKQILTEYLLKYKNGEIDAFGEPTEFRLDNDE